MDSPQSSDLPGPIEGIEAASRAIGFTMGCDRRTGALLRTLAASKPGGRFLELGTGTGLGTAWLLAGMDRASGLVTVELDPEPLGVAKQHLAGDQRVHFHFGDAGEFLRRAQREEFDLVFADTWPGKFEALDEALALVAAGGVYCADDLLPQPGWPDGHGETVRAFIRRLESRPELVVVRLAWSSGLILATRSTARP